MAKLSRGEKAKRETRLAPEEEPEFQIAPMIDILLVLLVFFMSISSTEVLQSNKNIQLPVAKNALKAKENPGQRIINITWDVVNNSGEIEMDGINYTLPEIPGMVAKIQERLLVIPDMRVLVRADKYTQYSFLREILKAVGDAGVGNVTFSAVDKDITQPGAATN